MVFDWFKEPIQRKIKRGLRIFESRLCGPPPSDLKRQKTSFFVNNF